MSKASGDNGAEALIYKAETLEQGIKIRSDLTMKFSGCWFLLYSNTCELYVTNEFGGRINNELLEKLKARAQEFVTEGLS